MYTGLISRMKNSTSSDTKRGRKRKFPRYVVDCSSSSKERYGVKLKVGRKSVRIGSNYHDTDSASKVAESAKMYLSIDESGFYRLNEKALEMKKTCLIFPKKDEKALKRRILSILQDFVQVKNAKLSWKLGQRNASRKRSKETIPDEIVKKKNVHLQTEEIRLSENFLVEAYREDLLDIEDLLIKLNILSAEVHQCKTGSRQARELVQNSKRDLALLRKEIISTVRLIQKARKKH